MMPRTEAPGHLRPADHSGTRQTGGRRHVAILLATYQGARYLQAQLDSYLAQDHEDWSLWVSDDGSTDATRDILDAFRQSAGRRIVEVASGPGRGSFQNFMHLLCNPAIGADYYAISDQDDAWLPSHLSRAIALVDAAPAGPVLYGGRTIVTDARLVPQGESPIFRLPPGFRNALVQNISGGNTMVLNRAARAIVERAGPPRDAVCHDWWLYQLLSGAGARVIYDALPTVLYRQHGANQIGSNLGRMAQVRRAAGLLSGRYRDWNRRNLAALDAARDTLSAEHAAILDGFVRLRGQRGMHALAALRALGLYRQTRLGQLSLAVAALAGLL